MDAVAPQIRQEEHELTLNIEADGAIDAATADGDMENGRVALRPAQREVLTLFDDWARERRLVDWRDYVVFGRLLWDALFNDDVTRLLDRAADRAAEADMPLRLQLFFKDQEDPLAQLPWEYLFRARPGGGSFLATDPALVLSRYLPLHTPRGSIAPDGGPLRVLIALAKPADLRPVATREPVEAIRRLEQNGTIEVHEEPTATIEALLAAIMRVQPDVLHVMGHGTWDDERRQGRIALLDAAGKADWVTDANFATILEQPGAPPALVVLHLCEGGAADYREDFAGLGPQVVRHGAQAVIAMQHVISNRAAVTFTTSFYAALARNARVDEATQASRRELLAEAATKPYPRDFGTPVLFMRSRSSALVTDAGAS